MFKWICERHMSYIPLLEATVPTGRNASIFIDVKMQSSKSKGKMS